MKNFFKSNKWISTFLVIALVYSVYYIVISDKETALSMFYPIALSYISAFIFYILQVYYPMKKRLITVNKVIKKRVKNIIIKIDDLYQELFKKYIPNYNNDISVELHMKDLLSININDITSHLNISKTKSLSFLEKESHCTFKELIQELIISIKENIDFLYKTFPELLSDDLINILENISNSFFMRAMPLAMQSSIRFDFSKCDVKLFEELWELKKELKKCIDQI